jgi:hypothetical protein
MPIMTMVAFFGWVGNHYCPNDAFNPYCVYVYVLIVHNISQLVAMYCLSSTMLLATCSHR